MEIRIIKWFIFFAFIVETTVSWRRRGRVAQCSASGDPHYATFDNKRYDFMGICKYVFAKDVNGNFLVLAKNKRCGATASCTFSVTVIVRHLRIRLFRGVRHFTVNRGRRRGSYNARGVRVSRYGHHGFRITTNIGLTVLWDGNMNLHVMLSPQYRGKTVGLCGNYNGNPHDDFIDRWGQFQSSIHRFGESWNVQRNCPGAPQPPNPCRNAGNIAKNAKKKCSLLRKQPFTKCNNRLHQVSRYIRDCEYDVCTCGKHPTACMCEEVAAYATSCALAGIRVSWRNLPQFAECSGPCGSFPCQNGGLCDARGKGFKCTCPRGYSGKTCSELTCKKPKPFGMQSGKIRDIQITASTIYYDYQAWKARLKSSKGSWWTIVGNRNQWLQVDFKYRATIVNIFTQGHQSSNYFVRSYTLSYSSDGLRFKTYKVKGRVRVFSGNTYFKSVVQRSLKPVIVARFIRINPQSWSSYIAMRVEFSGCFEDQPCANEPCKNEGECSLNEFGDLTCSCRAGYLGSRCEQKDCRNPFRLGMENGNILDTQISASSMRSVHVVPSHGRLNKARGYGSWSPASDNKNQWLQVDFRRQATIVAILTQGRHNNNYWVKTYSVSYSHDGINFFDYRKYGRVQVLRGNRNRNAVVTRQLSPVIVAQYIRLHPKTWQSRISLRVDFHGCLKEWPCRSRPCRNGGTCLNYLADYRCACRGKWTGRHCEKSTVCKWACASKPCLNGGTCLDYKGGYRCSCTDGWTGRNCERNFWEPCKAKPCLNGGTCVPHRGYYVCACGKDWSGRNCEHKVEICKKPRLYEV